MQYRAVFTLALVIVLGAGTLAMAFACKTVGVRKSYSTRWVLTDGSPPADLTVLFLILLSGVALLANYSVSLLGLAMVKAQKTSTRDAASFNVSVSCSCSCCFGIQLA